MAWQAMRRNEVEHDDKTEVALWRFGVIGPLVSARLEHGDVRALCKEASRRTYERWDGKRVEVKARTVEGWYYAHKRGGLTALRPQGRSDAGTSRAIGPEMAERIVALKRENPRRSIRRIIRMLERAKEVRKGELKRSTVHRLLQAHGISGQPARPGDRERRAYRPAFVGDLWMGDVMHGPLVVSPGGPVRKSYLHLFLDAATRFVPSAAFRLGERAIDHQVVLKQAVLKHGLPRVLYLDQGSAQTADSLRLICAELGVRLLHCRPYDPAAKAGIERLFRTIRAEILDELPEGPIPLAELNAALWSWLSAEYHVRVHGGTKQPPLQHWLEQAQRLRPAPRREELDVLFLHRAQRKVRKDGTVRFGGQMLEVRPELCGRTVELRFDPERPTVLPQVYMDGRWVCDTCELDLARNSRRRRRPRAAAAAASPEPTGLDPLQQIQAEHDRRIRPPNSGTEE